jgi:hypothetical protein
VVIPFGTAGYVEEYGFNLIDRAISAQDHILRDSWSDQPYEGSVQYLDAPPHDLIDQSGARQTGCNGLLALYIIHKDAVGRGSGVARNYHTPALGIAIPGGGPTFQVVANYDIES